MVNLSKKAIELFEYSPNEIEPRSWYYFLKKAPETMRGPFKDRDQLDKWLEFMGYKDQDVNVMQGKDIQKYKNYNFNLDDITRSIDLKRFKMELEA